LPPKYFIVSNSQNIKKQERTEIKTDYTTKRGYPKSSNKRRHLGFLDNQTTKLQKHHRLMFSIKGKSL
jgi:hypothetical protein